MDRREFLWNAARGILASAAFVSFEGCNGCQSNWIGRTSTDSHGAGASPAMTTWNNSTLVLVWGGGDGTVYLATGMEKSGVVQGTPIPGVKTLERMCLIQFQDRLVLAYIDTNNVMQCVLSYDGKTFGPPQPWLLINQSPWTPSIGGPALVSAGSNVKLALTAQINQFLHTGFSVNPPTVYEDSQTQLKSIDTPSLAIAPDQTVQLAFAGPDDPFNHLNLQPNWQNDNLPAAVVYPDQCFGGPALVYTGLGYAAAYAGKNTNIYFLYGIENLNPNNVRRTKLQDTTWHAPAAAIANGTTYVAWIGTDQPAPTGSLNFAAYAVMPPVYTDGSG